MIPKRDVAAFAVPAAGGLARKLPMETSGLLSEAADGKGFASDRTFRTSGGDRWKCYVGGQAPHIFVYDAKSGQQTQVTHWVGTDTAPMWWRNRLYFLSDRGPSHRLDLWVTDPTGLNPRQVSMRVCHGHTESFSQWPDWQQRLRVGMLDERARPNTCAVRT